VDIDRYREACWRDLATPPQGLCATCVHVSRPRPPITPLCRSGNPALEPAYGPGHPLRRMPPGGAKACTHYQPLVREVTMFG
jgi:hypothetical protein